MNFIFISFLLFINLYAYTDNDIDGVDDSIDKCLNTSFDDIVDINGCAINKKYYGKVNLEFSYLIQNTLNDTSNIKNLYLNYEYHNMLMSLSNGIYTSNNKTYNTDTYITFSYNISKERFLFSPSFGIKIANDNSAISSKEEDYFISFKISSIINNSFSYSLSSTYAIIGNNGNTNYNNYLNYNLSLSYKNNFSIEYINSGLSNSLLNEYKSIQLSYNYDISNKLYTQIKYNQSILSSNTNDIIILLGYNFE